jgi:hypothetical protein
MTPQHGAAPQAIPAVPPLANKAPRGYHCGHWLSISASYSQLKPGQVDRLDAYFNGIFCVKDHQDVIATWSSSGGFLVPYNNGDDADFLAFIPGTYVINAYYNGYAATLDLTVVQ